MKQTLVQQEKIGEIPYECICGGHNFHTRECKTHNRKIYLNIRNRIYKKLLRQEEININLIKKQYLEDNNWSDCICGNRKVHTPECKKNHSKNKKYEYSIMYRRNLRQERRKKHKCAICGKNVKPIKIYPYRCDECKNGKRRNN